MPSWLPFSLLALACPIGMGLMMLFMMRGMRGQHQEHAPKDASAEERLARLEAEKRDLERQIAASKDDGHMREHAELKVQKK